eukprot:PhF_6_TR10980/c0_g1_i2/m.17742/K01639/E4.1.3.3, nanA, NPL; N-acetylneuraminate lyase
MTGVAINIHSLLTTINTQYNITNFAGVKFTDYDLFDFTQSVHFAKNGTGIGKYKMYFGRDEVLLSALVMGASGAVGSTYNFLGKAARALVTTNSLEWQRRIQNVVVLMNQYGGLQVGKAIMAMLGLEVGPCRAPNYPPQLPSATVSQLKAALDAIG